MVASYNLKMISRLENPKLDTFTVTCEYMVSPCTPAVRRELYQDLLGGFRMEAGVFRYFWPKADAVFPWLYASDVKLDPIEDDYLLDTAEDEAQYANDMKVTVIYEPRVIEEVDLVRRERDFTVRNLTLPNQYMKWKTTKTDGGDPTLVGNDGIQATKTFPQVDYHVTRYFVRREPADAINQLAGRVNEKGMTLGNDHFRKETLRFEGAKTSQRVTNFGVKFWEITYKFIVLPVYDKIVEYAEIAFDASPDDLTWVGWNRIFNPRVSKWERVVLSTDATRGMYEYDTDVPDQRIRGNLVEGFNLLFTDGAT